MRLFEDTKDNNVLHLKIKNNFLQNCDEFLNVDIFNKILIINGWNIYHVQEKCACMIYHFTCKNSS